MTKISEYPIISNPTEDDILIGTDVNSSDVTKNFSIGSIISLADETIKPYKVYTALLTQQEDNDPVATILENTLGGVPTIIRNSAGVFDITLAGAFTVNKTVVFALGSKNDGSEFKAIKFDNLPTLLSPDSFTMYTADSFTSTNTDEFNAQIEIRVYN
jgi:hypothetical protein